jgi:F-type H+-transporting ATPase subunit epsilon
MALQVELVSPERVAFSGEAKSVIARVADGDIAFLSGHIPFVGTLQTHPVRVLGEDGGEQIIAVHQGFVQFSNDRVTILSDVCELSEDIDVPRAQAAKERAAELLRADANDAEAQGALRRAEVRLEAAGANVASKSAH